MNMITSEIRYFERRLRSTLEMEKACSSMCGRQAHRALAELYALKVKDLQATPFSALSIPAAGTAVPSGLHQKRLDRSIAKDVPQTMSSWISSTRKTGTLSMVGA